MRRMFQLLFVIAIGMIGFAGQALAQRVPIEVYGKDEDISAVTISADGNLVAMARSENGKPYVFVFDLTTNKAARYDIGELKIRSLAFSSDSHLLVYVSKTTNIMQYRVSKTEFCGVFSIDVVARSKPIQLLGGSKQLALQSSLCGVESHLWTKDGEVLMSARVDDGGDIQGASALLLVNGNNGRGKVVSKGTRSTWSWVASPKGHVIARVDNAQKNNTFRVSVPTDEERFGEFKVVFSDDTELPSFTVYGANADESALIVGTRWKSGLFGLFELSLKDGKIGQPLYEPDGVDISGVITDPYTGTVVGAAYDKVRREQIFFQNDLQQILMAATKGLTEWDTVHVVTWDRARKRYVIYAEGNKSAGEYFVFDVTTSKLQALTSVRPELDNVPIAPVKPFYYKTRDDLTIQAYLTTPPGADAKNLPLVAMPHGGPAARDVQQFDYWAQALASRGYAIVQMNFRGSEGYGSQFENAGDEEWGGKMQDDVTDAVKHLVDTGVADASKVCIVGGSYGGYSAMAGAAFTPDIYKCAVAFAPVTDLKQFIAWKGKQYGVDSSTYEYWIDIIGHPTEKGDMLEARSPVNAADKVTADVLLIHGKDDTVVPLVHSEKMYDALKKAGKPVQFVKLDGEDHWLSTEKTRIEMLKLLETFLAKHLG
jgi:dipeptidyl aminopeptidase/acylaminoacyl peptidase